MYPSLLLRTAPFQASRGIVSLACPVRPFRRIEDKRGVDEPGYEPPPPDPEVDFDEPETVRVANPVGVGLAVVGGALLALAGFLPLDESNSPFGRVAHNTLIQNGEWWLLVGGAVIVLAAATTKRIAVIVLSLIAGALVVHYATDDSLRTLYTIGSSGEAEGSGTVVPFGIAIYVAGAGAVLAFIGGLTLLRTQEAVPPPAAEETKRCPECAETILAAARVCKHCGARLDGSEPRAPYPPAPA